MRGGTEPARRQGAPAGGEDASGEESAWKQLAAYPGLESCTTFRSLWGVFCLKPPVKEAGGKEGACTGSSGKCGSGFPGTVRLGLRAEEGTGVPGRGTDLDTVLTDAERDTETRREGHCHKVFSFDHPNTVFC